MFDKISTNKEKRSAIRLLKSAHNRIRNYKNSVVCCAVEDSEWSPTDVRVSAFIRSEISYRIGGYGYVTSWLRNAHPEVVAALDSPNGDEHARFYRMRWIQSMIQEIKELNV